MINQEMFDLGAAPNKIRELYMYGLMRKAEIGEANVFDYSIGNPSVPAPPEVKAAFLGLLDQDPVTAHEYTPSPGDPKVRNAIADWLSRKYGVGAEASNIYITSGASSAVAISIRALTNPGDEVITPSPYFPEYKTWSGNAGCTLVEVPVLEPSFQLDVPAIEAAVTDRTSAIVIDSPNNPTGAVYTRESLERLADALRRKERELGRRIYIINDEPYRDIVYGKEVPYIPSIYADTISCYTWSKALSLPGERLGYIHVNDEIGDAAAISTAISGAGRALGYICAPVIIQRVVAACLDIPADVEEYARNRKILTDMLSEIGYEFVEPDGAFYLWMRALEPDSNAFSERAKDFELLIVPSDSFGCSGWARLCYCIAQDTIKRSRPALQALYDSYKR